MALSFTTKISQAIRTWKLEGHIVAEVEMTTTTGANGADYSSGFDLATNKGKIGFRSIFRCHGFTIVNGAAATVLGTSAIWDHQSGKIRVVLSTTGAEDSGGGTLVTANSKIRFLVWGV